MNPSHLTLTASQFVKHRVNTVVSGQSFREQKNFRWWYFESHFGESHQVGIQIQAGFDLDRETIQGRSPPYYQGVRIIIPVRTGYTNFLAGVIAHVFGPHERDFTFWHSIAEACVERYRCE